ncbi:MAG: hypothetical protein ACP5VR_12995 [Acidimicrobiales bacterium]
MADKLEVLPGPGLVARFGDVLAWAGPQCSAALYSHLANEVLRASQTPSGGDWLANSLIAVLQRGDPEPHAPFAVVGPGANGLTLFLHGPVQAWDSGRWLSPQPVPGWMVVPIGRPWPLIILAYGAAPPPPSQQGNPFDLVRGVVPGSGVVLLRPEVPSAQAMAAGPQAAQAPAVGQVGHVSQAQPEAEAALVDLRGLTAAPPAPLPLATYAGSMAARAGQLEVTGVRCEQGHFNHPKASRCLLCGRPLSPAATQLTGPQPCLGVLLADDGSIWALDRGCLIGAQPETAPEVQSGALQAITLKAGPGNTMAPVQAEVQLVNWGARLVDRGAEGSTWVQPPGAPNWRQLGRYEHKDLPNGSHLSCGGRVLTYLSAWPV